MKLAEELEGGELDGAAAGQIAGGHPPHPKLQES